MNNKKKFLKYLALLGIIIGFTLIIIGLTDTNPQTTKISNKENQNSKYSIEEIQSNLTKFEYLTAIQTNTEKYEKYSYSELFKYFINNENFEFYKLTKIEKSNIILDYFEVLIHQRNILNKYTTNAPPYIQQATQENVEKYLMQYDTKNNKVIIDTTKFLNIYQQNIEENKKELISLYAQMQNHNQLTLSKQYESLINFYNFYKNHPDTTILFNSLLDEFTNSLTAFSWRILDLKNNNPENIQNINFKDTFLIDFINLLKYTEITPTDLQDQINNMRTYMQRIMYN